MKTYYTYLWLREDGTPFYVGKGCEQRAFRAGGRHHIKPPGKDRILLQEFPDEDSAFCAEKFLISFYGRIDVGTGCLRNMTDGGEGVRGKIVSIETREKIRAIVTGAKHSLKTRAKMSAARKGHVVSEETREKLHRANLGQIPWIKGKHLSAATKEKLRLAHEGKHLSEEHRAKLSARKIGHTPWNKGKRYKKRTPVSPETRRKISEKLQGNQNGCGPHSAHLL